MSAYRAIAGLGNPGDKYAQTRHNIGFMLADLVVQGAADCIKNPSGWKDKFGGLVSEAVAGDRKVLVIKPMSFMNRSGLPTGEAMQFYRIQADELIVIHDDIDLPFGVVRMKSGGGDGGHNGIKSIASSLGTKDFVRLRLGVGRPPQVSKPGDPLLQVSGPGMAGERPDIASWVLGRFSVSERESLPSFLQKGLEALQVLIEQGLSVAQRQFN